MKLALTGIASVGILAVTVGMEAANAQPYRRYGPARTYAPQAYPSQSRGSIPRGIPRTVPFSDPNSPEATGGGNIGYNHGLRDRVKGRAPRVRIPRGLHANARLYRDPRGRDRRLCQELAARVTKNAATHLNPI